MTIETPMKPQDQVIYLLGELKGQVGSLQSSVDTSLANQASINATVQNALTGLRSDVDVLKAQMPHRASWWSIASGIASIAAIVVVIIQLFAK